MDPTPNSVNPPPTDHPHGPTDPGHLPPDALVPTPRNNLSAWVRVNGWKLGIMAAVIAFVCWKFYWVDVLLAGLGLSLIIFLHELGHFLAAKLCNVYVRTFSIGFGPAWPFCQFKVGETNYKLGMIPLGGFVAMAGEPTGETDPDAAKDDVDDDTDPRSFKNRPVWQRMIIISAGVVMNVILAAICFITAYSFGVKETPAIVQTVEPGAAAWQAGIRPGTQVTKINGIDHPWFADIPPEVASTNKGGTVHLETAFRGQSRAFDIEPLIAEGGPNPQLGVSMVQSVQLYTAKRDPMPPYGPDTPAYKANEKAAKDGTPLILHGDTVVGMTDPADPARVTPLADEWNGLRGKSFDFRRRLSALAGKPITLELQRLEGGERVTVVLPPAFRQDSGLRMKMGQIAAVRAGSAAEGANFNRQQMDGDKMLSEGDVITKVVAGGVTLFDPADKKANNPLRLPSALNKWATETPGEKKVLVTVQKVGGGEETRELAWDDDAREDGFSLGNPNTPLPLGGLGLAYRVSNVVADVADGSAAATAGLKAGDVLTDVRFDGKVFKQQGMGTFAPEAKSGSWDVVKGYHWAYVDFKLQVQPPHTFEFKADRDGAKVAGTITAVADESWGVPYTGLDFMPAWEVKQATGPWNALELGAQRTVRGIKTNYQGLYGIISGRISPLTMSGPITLATMSYKLAGEDLTTLVLLLGLISVSLAVVNFLPIPVLDGGHMVFLIYEAIFRKPAPVIVQNVLTIAGLVAVLCLMVFTIGLDVWKLWFKG